MCDGFLEDDGEGGLIARCVDSSDTSARIIEVEIAADGTVAVGLDARPETVSHGRPMSWQQYVLSTGTSDGVRNLRFADDKRPKAVEIRTINSNMIYGQFFIHLMRLEEILRESNT